VAHTHKPIPNAGLSGYNIATDVVPFVDHQNALPIYDSMRSATAHPVNPVLIINQSNFIEFQEQVSRRLGCQSGLGGLKLSDGF